MFRATFLGNHGWLVEGGRDALLVDPLLSDGYGWTASVGLRVWPPRRFAFDRFPRVSAVFLTHEHEGHFDIASLHRLDRRIPIHVSSLSSLALREALREMGFSVHPVAPGESFSKGDIDVHTMPAEQDAAWGEEWDNLAFLVRDREGDGSLFTPVDVAPTRAMRRAVEAVQGRPGLWAHTNNFSSWDFAHQRAEGGQRPLEKLVRNVFDYHLRLSDLWERPEALLLYGGGFSFDGARSFIEREIFTCDTFEAARVLSLMLPGERVLTPVPGSTYTMQAGTLVSVAEESEVVSALPRAEWPRRGREHAVTWLQDFEPATGRRDFPDTDLPELERELRGFAEFLYSKVPFRRLCSLREGEIGARKATVALRLRRRGGPAHVFEYQPQGCRFTRVQSADPAAEYLGVYECWATDLLALFRAEIASPSLALGRSRHFAPERELFDLDLFLMQYAHPLRHPARFLELYRRVISAQPGEVPVIHAKEP